MGDGGWTDHPERFFKREPEPMLDRAALEAAHKHIACDAPEVGGPHWTRPGPACGWKCPTCAWVCSASSTHGYGPQGPPKVE
jgi:hypothetical protein